MKPIWIGTLNKNDANNTLPPELFRKVFGIREGLTAAKLTVSAMGIYRAQINGENVSENRFAPGYTHYESYVQSRDYDVAHLLSVGCNTIDITVANGWWLGTLGNRNNRYGDHQGLIASLRLTYSDGSHEEICTDESWLYTCDSPERFSDFYCGETIDLTREDENGWKFHPAVPLSGKLPKIIPQLGTDVTVDCCLTPVSQNGDIYDFGQNHAGVIHLSVRAKPGTVITIRHAELLGLDGGLFTENLRTAKQTLTLICKNGISDFVPQFTYMGFRYIEIKSSAPINILCLESLVLTSDCPETGSFSCSNDKINRLQQNIQWSQRANFMDIPTDCPQRDERMGWTGDIAVFAQTAAFNRDILAFMRKWLYDLALYQNPNGSLPVTIPKNPTYDPTGEEGFPIAIWGDAATMVPWAVWKAYADISVIEHQYDSMKAYTEAELRAAAATGEGLEKYLWNSNPFQYGDWCAPGESYDDWLKKGDFLATSYMANSVQIMIDSARLLNKADDAEHYSEILENIKKAFDRYCIKEDGRLTGDFQSNYVCALYFGLVPEDKRAAVAKRLAELVRENNYLIHTGFAGTPYILFALADNGYVDDAYKLLLNEECPGWLYTVNAGGTTMWERWDALAKDGTIKADALPEMVSFNHYAYGTVGDFLYRRVLGLEPIEAGYKRFSVKPVLGGGITHAEGSLETRHGRIEIAWRIVDSRFVLDVTVPDGTTAEITPPDGNTEIAAEGRHRKEIML